MATFAFLEAKSMSQSTHTKLLSAFYFLEWLDGSRTMSKQAVSRVLDIDMGVAGEIVTIRNHMIHHQGDQNDVFSSALVNVQARDPKFVALYRGVDNPSIFWTNVIFSLCGKALLHRIGFQGKSDHYIPSGNV